MPDLEKDLLPIVSTLLRSMLNKLVAPANDWGFWGGVEGWAVAIGADEAGRGAAKVAGGNERGEESANSTDVWGVGIYCDGFEAA